MLLLSMANLIIFLGILPLPAKLCQVDPTLCSNFRRLRSDGNDDDDDDDDDYDDAPDKVIMTKLPR